MWERFTQLLVCPICKGPVGLSKFKETTTTIADDDAALAQRKGIFDDDFNRFVESGLVLCHSCKRWYPITGGLPVLLPYTTALHHQFAVDFRDEISQLKLNYEFPCMEPVRGERFVMASFSREWLDYHYDGVLWDESYQDLEDTFSREVNLKAVPGERQTFLEVGCGLGVTTHIAHKRYKVDAVGVDLSLASMRASQHYKNNPFLHFVQASAFYLPFQERSFDVVYSRGVLHHTFSTREAFKAIAHYTRPGGTLYIWVYGPKSIRESWLRRAAYLAEVAARPVLSKRPSSPFSRAFLSAVALGYLAFNAIHRRHSPNTQKYNFERALHAARDRFTPQYAHRHDLSEVVEWFQQAGFEEIEVVNWQIMPVLEQEAFRRNVGVRAKRK